MPRRLFPSLLLCLSISLALLPSAFAGVVLEFENRDPHGGPAGAPDRLFAQGEMLRMEPGDSGSSGFVMIFRADEMLILEESEKKYYRMDEAMMDELAGQMNAAMKQMEAQLAGMPKEQRAMVEKMMKGKLPGGTIPEMTLEEVGNETIGEYSCRKYVLSSDGEKMSEIFTTTTGAVEGASEAMQGFKAMARFTEKLFSAFRGSPMAGMFKNPFPMMDRMEGVPVLTRQYEGGSPVRETSLKSSVRQDLDESMFAPPEGYKEADLMKMAGGN